MGSADLSVQTRDGVAHGQWRRPPVRPRVGLRRRRPALDLRRQRQAHQHQTHPVVEPVPALLEGAVVQHDQWTPLRHQLRVRSERAPVLEEGIPHGTRVVVVDDNETNRRILDEVLLVVVDKVKASNQALLDPSAS